MSGCAVEELVAGPVAADGSLADGLDAIVQPSSDVPDMPDAPDVPDIADVPAAPDVSQPLDIVDANPFDAAADSADAPSPPDSADVGIVADGGSDVANCEVSGVEICNGVDDDCDGSIDEGTCDDGNNCTLDACQGAVCGHAAADGACDSGQACTFGGECAGGACVVPTAVVASVVGSSAGWVDGQGAQAKLSFPSAIALMDDGATWVADSGNHRIRRVSNGGLVSTVAGSGQVGALDGQGVAATFNVPAGLARAGTETMLVADSGNHRLRRLTIKGAVDTLAGMDAGFADGVGTAARFSSPVAVAVGPGGVAYLADRDNHRVRRIMPAGTVTTLAGAKSGFADGLGPAAAFKQPSGIASDGDGALYVSDAGNRRIRRVSLKGLVITVAGSGAAGWTDGKAALAQFVLPAGLVMDASGRLLIADRGSHRVRVLGLDGLVGTLAGSGVPGFVDGAAVKASFLSPSDVVVRPTGEVLVADRGNHRLRRLHGNQPGCTISGLCWQAGMPNPAAPCAACLPDQSVLTWSLLAPAAWCRDGDPCTEADVCTNGQCVGASVDCDDGEPCTKDACLQPTGSCSHEAILGCSGFCKTDAECLGDNPCSQPGVACVKGKCVNTGPVQVATLVGSVTGSADGPAAIALLGEPAGLDFAPDGDLIFADRGNHRIRQLTSNGVVSTLAGSGFAGHADGGAKKAAFQYPADVATAPAGVIWIADAGNHRIRKLAANGVVQTVAGAAQGFADGKGSVARFSGPRGIARTPGGVRYVADTDNHRLRRIALDGTVSTLAGSVPGHLNGSGLAARFQRPWALAVDGAGNVLVADRDNHRIRRVTPEGQVSDLIGIGQQGSLDGPAGLAMLDAPVAVALDALGRVYLAGAGNHRIRRLDTTGSLTPWAGSGSVGWLDGAAIGAMFHSPAGLAVRANGQVAVADAGNHRLRAIQDGAGACAIGGACWAHNMPSPVAPCLVCAGGKVWQVALKGSPCDDGQACTGNGGCSTGKCSKAPAKNCNDGDACTKDSCDPGSGACVNLHIPGCKGWCDKDAHCQSANPCRLGEACVDNKCDLSKALQVTTPAGGVKGWLDGAASKARFNGPVGLVFDSQGELWLADPGNHVVRRMDKKGVVSTAAGVGKAGYQDGAGNKAAFDQPWDVAPWPAGAVLVADAYNHRIRRIGPTLVVSTLAGGPVGYADGKGEQARFNRPRGLAATPGGVAYVADTLNHRIRKLWPDGQVTTLAGSVAGHANGAGSAARFQRPVDVAVDGWGNVIVADRDNHRLRRISPDGVVSDLAGGAQGYVDGSAAKARFHLPGAVAVDGNGIVWVADTFNNRIRALSRQGTVSTFAGSGTPDWLDGPGADARFQLPGGVAVDPQGWLWVSDSANHRLRRVLDSAGSCFIDGQCLAPGLAKGPVACAFCGSATALGWSTALNGTPCGDGGPCTKPGACLAGLCKAGSSKTCDDKEPCTQDSCESASGACVYKLVVGCSGKCLADKDCDDGNPCTVGHACTSGQCKAPGIVRVSTLAGGAGGFADGAGPKTKFSGLSGLCADGQGGWVIADRGNHRIRRWQAGGNVSTLAGSGKLGLTDGAAQVATFYHPADVAPDKTGGYWIADAGNHAIRRVVADTVTLIAGVGIAGDKDGTGSLASFNAPVGIACGVTGVAWVADRDNHRIRRVGFDGKVATFAGGLPGYVDGPVELARFSNPEALAVGPDGRLWVADTGNHRLRRIEAHGVVITAVGLGVAGNLDGPVVTALLAEPNGVAIDSGGTVWISDRLTHRIRRLVAGNLFTIAGWAAGFMDGDDTAASFDAPAGLAVNADGQLAVADRNNHRLRSVVTSAGTCHIGGVCRAPGLAAPTKPCLRCRAEVSVKVWTAEVDGASCSDGSVCTVGDACASVLCKAGATQAACAY